ncbi:acyltransferase [Ornithinibacillus sp. 179-J 7C1 HS]|uniref:acyltransferase n=1 Tax=Ornithinibacillus sp. 179-J 7C1 HS TaxID=3142384 RepID=UPI0039A035C6
MIGYITLLRATTMIFVLLIHITAAMLSQELSVTWWVGNFFDGISRFSVPVYLMISGALLLSKDEPIKTFFHKRMSKIMIPFLFWVSFYVVWYHVKDLSSLSVGTFIREWLSDGSYYHLWFLFTIIGLYLTIPILRKVTQQSDIKIAIYFVVIWFVATAISGLFSHFAGYSHGFRLDMFKGFTGYLLLGYILTKIEITPIIERIAYILGSIGLFFTLYGTYIYKLENGSFTGFWYGNLTFTTIFVALAVFVFFKQRFKNYQPGKLVNKMSEASFGIFLIHPFILSIFASSTFEQIVGFKIYYTLGHPVVGVLISLICLYITSFVAVLIIQKIPYLRRIV